MTEPVLQLENVTFNYGNTMVLDNIRLSVCRGDFLGIVGPNGSGKSTLLKIVLGLLRPAAGHVRLFGNDLSSFRDWSRIGYVPQKATAFSHGFPATVHEVVLSGLTGHLGLFRRPGRREQNRVDSVLADVGVTDLQSRLVGELSGGQQQRVLIARVLVSQPELLILDEPTVGVDLEAQARFYSLLAELRQQNNLTLIMVSHDIGVVTEHVTSVACLNKKLYFHGTASEFCSGNTLALVYGPNARVLHHAH